MHPPALAPWFADDYIHGDRFAALGEIRIESLAGPIPEESLDQGRILYCKTDRAAELFEVIRNRTQPCILITHNADHNVTAALWASKPECVRHWFAQNAEVNRPNLTPIPIGLERPFVSNGRSRPEVFQAAARQAAPMQNLAYLNYADWTNRWERTPVRWSLCWRNWVTVRRGPVPIEQYVHEMKRHRSVISPPGNGLDCHRTWEVLYLGVIPLVRDSFAMRAFARVLPIALFGRLVTLTRPGVEQELTKVFNEASADWQEHLRFSYWAQRILRMRDELCGG